MKKIKKLLLVLMVVMLFGTLVSCGNDSEESEINPVGAYFLDKLCVTDLNSGEEVTYSSGDVVIFKDVVEDNEVLTEVEINRDLLKFNHNVDRTTLVCELFKSTTHISGRVSGSANFTGNNFIYNINVDSREHVNFKNGINNLAYITGYITYEDKPLNNGSTQRTTYLVLETSNEEYQYSWVLKCLTKI